MDRRKFLSQSVMGTFLLGGPWADGLGAQGLPIERGAPAPEPIPEPHFPDRLHLFVWRNWELANTDRMATVLGTAPANVLEIGGSMGLPGKPQLTEDQLRRIYITTIRQNWHVLPDDQLMELLGWDAEHYGYTLKEDDFLWHKLGALKPHCERLQYDPPSPGARQRAAEINRLVRETFGSALVEREEPAFQFVAELSSTRIPAMPNSAGSPAAGEVDLRRGWSLREAAEHAGIPARLVEEFRSYLQAAFGCEMAMPRETTSDAKVLELGLDADMEKAPGSFQITVEPERVRVLGSGVAGLRQGLYHLQAQMEEREGPYLPAGSVQRACELDPRYVYSYFALYGDPLMQPEIDPFPGGVLEKLARRGVNGVWLQAVLRTLAPSKVFPEFGEGWQTRLKNLNKLVERAQDYGVKIYLYLNEPRSMPAAFFDKYPNTKGTYDGNDPQYFAMCTSAPEVRDWLRESLAHVFSQVPGLGGIFCITASENLTNCYSHGRAQYCPRCSKRTGAEVVSEVIQTFRDGTRQSSSEAKVIAWDWGWGTDWVRHGADASGIIARLPKDVALLSVSEWDAPVDRGGFHTQVREYSISVVGPGPRSLNHWALAKERGLSTLAKVQWSATWEISAVPYIPVPNLIIQHCENLRKAGIEGLMMSWTVGGYPSPNFDAAQAFYFSPQPDAESALRLVARRRYGKQAAPAILEAWETFSKAFQEFPYGVAIYTIPTQHGPANPLRLHSTGYKAAMMLFPYDDYASWMGPYPVEIVQKQFDQTATMWEPGLASFRAALAQVPSQLQAAARQDFAIAETCYLHFRSVANQIRFYMRRAEWETAAPQDRPPVAAQMIKIAENEIQLARRQYALSRQNSTIGFEASNQYYYRPLDLVEKVLNCRQVIAALRKV